MKRLDGRQLLADKGIEYFRGASAFGALSDEAIVFLLERGCVHEMADGEIVFRPGEAGGSFFVVLEGELAYSGDKGGREVAMRSIGVGEQLGYVSMIGLFERVGTGRASGAAVVLEVSSELFYQLHLELPFDFGILMLNLSRDMARTIRRYVTDLTAPVNG